VILDQAGAKVLISRRPDHVHLGGLWEFPGGKIQPGETVLTALTRELSEELNITVNQARPLIQINHDYDEQSVRLDVWMVTAWSGVPAGMEGQELRWVNKDALSQLEFPGADHSIIAAVNLPPLYGITPDLPEYGPAFLQQLEYLLDGGLRLLQFRSKLPSNTEQLLIIKKLFSMCRLRNCRLLYNGMPESNEILEFSHGLHLPSRDLLNLERRPLNSDFMIAASCHNEHELMHACHIGVDFAVLSPVKVTTSHPDLAPLGWQSFANIVDVATIPVYALGGMSVTDINTAQSCGGQGVAMISGLWCSQ